MQKSHLLRLFVSCMLVAAIYACTKHDLPYATDPVVRPYTVAQAKTFYESYLDVSRAGDEGSGPLAPMDYRLDWEQALPSFDSLLSSVDVPINLSRRYFHLQQVESDSCYLQPIYPKLVVVKEHPRNLEGVYLRYYLPSAEQMSRQPSSFYDGLLNSHPKYGFSGMSIYATLSGHPVCAVTYRDSHVQTYALLYDRKGTLEENAALLDSLLATARVFRTVEPASRATGEDQGGSGDPGNGREIEVVVIEGKRPPIPTIPDYPPPVPDMGIEERVFGGGGGGGGGSGTQTESGDDENPDEDEEEEEEEETDSLSTYKYNDKIQFTDERIEELLDSLFEDCMGKTLIMELGNVTIQTGQDANNSNGSIINLREHSKYGYRSYVLMEELIHCYQQQRDSHSVHPFPSIHYEIEAKVGWMMYLQRTGNELNAAQTKALLGHSYRGVVDLVDCLEIGVEYSNIFYQTAYQDAIYYLRHMKNGTVYPEDRYPQTNGSENWGFTNIYFLSIDCL